MTAHEIAQRLDAKRNGDGWKARCPAHEDRTPSLSIKEGSEGRVLLRCFAGCPVEAITEAMQIKMTDLFNKDFPVTLGDRALRSTVLKTQADASLPERREKLLPLPPSEEGRLSRWRGYSLENVQEWNKAGVFGIYKNRIAFSVPGGFHYRIKEDGSWRYSEGAQPNLFVLGHIEEGAPVHCFESQWDALAYADASGQEDNIVATRGASNVKLLADRLKGHTGTLYLWPQQDMPGLEWAQVIRKLMPEAQMKRVQGYAPSKENPWGYKDLNDWRKHGATEGQVFNAMLDARDFNKESVAESAEAEASGAHVNSVTAEGQAEGRLEKEGVGSAPLALILDQAVAYLRRYVAFPSNEHAIVCALWAAHTWVYEAFDYSPILHICSPEKGCGKSVLLDAIGLLCCRPSAFVNTTEAALFREIDKDKPTLLWDEIDNFIIEETSPFVGMLNAGYKVGGKVKRCKDFGLGLESFNVYCPKALTGIGKLPDTTSRRCLDIRLNRANKSEIEKFRAVRAMPFAEPIAKFFQGWQASARKELAETDIDRMPDELSGAQEDICEPLIAIADLAGGHWPDSSREALGTLLGAVVEQSEGEQLLSACRNAFGSFDRITTEELLERLIRQDSGPWAAWWENDVKRGNIQGPASKLAKILKRFDIKSGTIRAEDKVIKGYYKKDFAAAWASYLPPIKGMVNMELL